MRQPGLNGSSITILELDSSATYPDGIARPNPVLTRLVARGGTLVIDGVHVYSAIAGQADTDYTNGRSYLLAENGGRMDVLNSEISHLGYASGEPSGMAWREMGKHNGDPTIPDHIRTGATGSIKNSKIHDLYFGQYSFEAYGLVVTNNEFYSNVVYGFDPHDYSTGFEVAYNKVFNNGKHGIIFSRGCTLNLIHHNEVWGNHDHGIMLDRGSNNNQIYNNTVYNNSDGIAIFQSEKNLIKDNTLIDNERGVRINATYDLLDEFNGLANDNIVQNNIIRDNTQYGVYLYEGADRNIIQGNTIEGSSASGIYIKTGGNSIRGNTIRTNDTGVTVLGGDPITVGNPQGTPPYIPPLFDGGHNNTIVGNTISDNNSVGIRLSGAVNTIIGLSGPNPVPGDANIIVTNGTHHGNGVDGVLVKGQGSNNNLVSQTGITRPNAIVELYSDDAGQGRIYEASVTADASGSYSAQLDWKAATVNAFATDIHGNSSGFAINQGKFQVFLPIIQR